MFHDIDMREKLLAQPVPMIKFQINAAHQITINKDFNVIWNSQYDDKKVDESTMCIPYGLN